MHRVNRFSIWGVLGLLAVAFALLGCEPASNKPQLAKADTVPASTAPTTQKAAANAEQWNQAVSKNFDKVDTKKLFDKKSPQYVLTSGATDRDGITSFDACFEADKDIAKCKILFSAKRDTFRKIQFFRSPIMEWIETTARYSSSSNRVAVKAYISLRDCQRPSVLLQPFFFANSWIFIEQIAIMVDGTLAIEQKIDQSQVDRETDNGEVQETAHILLTPDQLAGFRKVAAAKPEQVLIRITGKKGYTGLSKESTEKFVKGAGDVVRAYDSIDAAVRELGQVVDPLCPA